MCSCWMESNNTKFAHSELILLSQLGFEKLSVYAVFRKVNICFPYSISIQTQLDI